MQPNVNLYNVDVCLCIDGTGRMHPLINNVKAQAKDFCNRYAESMDNYGNWVGNIRVRVIVFRDYSCDGEDAMVESEFFDMSDAKQIEAFEKFVDGIEDMGGGENSANSLEAIALALRSKWSPGGRYRRQAIILFTGAEPLPLQDPERMASGIYPEGMPKDLDELYEMFVCGDEKYAPEYSPRHGRLVIFSPNTNEIWEIFKLWENTWFVPTNPEGVCSEIDLEDAFVLLAGDF